ncbi:MAG: Hsp20/alpha crystallin family protein [Deltaproteobacteria bacterium]|nr:Hsp20/alpha crystallin family protein [Deltaproteobacteria bacterium]
MELMPWRPSGELTTLRREMDNLWNRFWGGTSLPTFTAEEWLPPVDLSETKENLLVRAELPGMDAKDIKVTISGDILSIKGEKREEKESKDEHCYCSERYAGAFQRNIRLPVNVKSDKINATFDKGVLQISLAKTEESKVKEIEVKVK